MSGLDKILAKIDEETARSVENIKTSAQAEIRRMHELSDKAMAEDRQRFDSQTEAKVSQLLTAAESAAHKDGKNLLLSTRRSEMEKVFSEALSRLLALKGEEKFSVYESLILQNAQPGEGELLLDQADAAQLPADFMKKVNAELKESSLVLAEETRETGGGLILRYGAIEINCCFAEMLSASRESLEDGVGRILFD